MRGELVHATAIACAGKCVLIRGPSGAGKSDLALRCLAMSPVPWLSEAAALVSDDQVRLVRQGDMLFASAPETIAGLMEIRGLGVCRTPTQAGDTRVTLIADLLQADEPPPDRLPAPSARVRLLGVDLPLLRLRPYEASAPIKLLLALKDGVGTPPG